MLIYSECDVTDDGFVAEMNGHTHVPVGKMNGIKISIEDEDYLMPSPQITNTKAHYMDLIGDAIKAGNYQFLNSAILK